MSTPSHENQECNYTGYVCIFITGYVLVGETRAEDYAVLISSEALELVF